jgi:hypothetical protein
MLKFVFQNYLKDEYQTLDTNLEHDYLDDCYNDYENDYKKDYENDYKNDYNKEDTDVRQKNNKFEISVTNDYHYIDKKNNNLKDDYGFFIDFETMEREVPVIKKRIQSIPECTSTHSPKRIPTQNSNTTSKEYVEQSDDEKKKPSDKNPEILFLCLTTMSIVIILTFA